MGPALMDGMKMVAIASPVSGSEAFVVSEDDRQLAAEPWAFGVNDIPWYAAALGFVQQHLGQGFGRRCLTVGSPLFEVRAMSEAGWRTTFLDARDPPSDPGAACVVKGDCTAMPFPSDFFDSLTSTCVLCHVGIGRYGDPTMEDGDRRALAEFSRVLKPGGRAAVMLGPCVPSLQETVVMGNNHRLYELDDAMSRCSASFQVVLASMWLQGRWLSREDLAGLKQEYKDQLERDRRAFLHHCYLCVLMEKEAKERR